MKILLLGGTGAMGIHLSQILSNKKENVVITSRSSRVSKKYIKINKIWRKKC